MRRIVFVFYFGFILGCVENNTNEMGIKNETQNIIKYCDLEANSVPKLLNAFDICNLRQSEIKAFDKKIRSGDVVSFSGQVEHISNNELTFSDEPGIDIPKNQNFTIMVDLTNSVGKFAEERKKNIKLPYVCSVYAFVFADDNFRSSVVEGQNINITGYFATWDGHSRKPLYDTPFCSAHFWIANEKNDAIRIGKTKEFFIKK